MKKFTVVPKLLKIYTKPVSIMVALFWHSRSILPHHENNAGVITFSQRIEKYVEKKNYVG